MELLKPADPCRSPKLREAVIRTRVTMFQASLRAIHFKHILNFGEGHQVSFANPRVTTNLRICGPVNLGLGRLKFGFVELPTGSYGADCCCQMKSIALAGTP